MDFVKIAQDVIRLEAKELIRASLLIDECISKAINILSTTSGKVIVMGVGKSGLVGAKLSATLSSTGTSSFFLHPTDALHGDLGSISKEDSLIAISYSGENEELLKVVSHIKRLKIPLIVLSKTPKSTLGSYADVCLSIKVDKEACHLNIAPTSSTTLTMAIGDAIAVCLMKQKNFKREDFASLHPGGILGKKLFKKASDFMKTKNLPIVDEKAILRDAILSMSRGKIGHVLFKNKSNSFVGILSDGDLRRALSNKNFCIDDVAIQYATKSPITINSKDTLAIDVLKTIESSKIQLLVVLNDSGEIVGTLHIHDLVEAGIS